MKSIKELCCELGFKQFSKLDLFQAIQTSNCQRIRLIASFQPELFLTHLNKQSPLSFAASKNAYSIIPLLINIGCPVNQYDKTMQTPIFHAIRRNHCLSVRLLIQNGANLKMTVGKYALTPLDYSILAGFYQIAYQIFAHLMQVSRLELHFTQRVAQFDPNSYFNFKHPRLYESIAKNFQYRYVNHQMLIKSLIQGIKPKYADLEALLTKKTQKKLNDPVYDPRQSCMQWICRVLKFEAPRKIEREQLPQQYRTGMLALNRLKFIVKNWKFQKSTKKQLNINQVNANEVNAYSQKRLETISNPYY